MKRLAAFLGMLMVGCGGAGPAGPAGATGPAGTSGLTVASNKIIGIGTADYCTQFAGESCFFRGGQRVKYTDGSVMLLGAFNFYYSSGGGDTDTDQNSVTAYFPANLSAGYMILSEFVARGSGYRRLFLGYDFALDQVAVVYDSDNSATLNAGDAILDTPTMSNWP